MLSKDTLWYHVWALVGFDQPGYEDNERSLPQFASFRHVGYDRPEFM